MSRAEEGLRMKTPHKSAIQINNFGAQSRDDGSDWVVQNFAGGGVHVGCFIS